jgi:hypothetical protein
MKLTREDLLNKVQILKNATSTDKKPLIVVKWDDDKIADQLHTYFESPNYENELEDEYTRIVNNLPINLTPDELKKTITDQIHLFLGWDKLIPMNPDFWQRMHHGSVCFTEVFINGFPENSFLNKLRYPYFLANKLPYAQHRYDNYKNRYRLKNEVHTSPWKNMNEMEEELSVKKIGAAAIEYYLDKAKPWGERLKVFNKYGEEHGCYTPDDTTLTRIFSYYMSSSYVQRHETFYCDDVIEWWLEKIYDSRCRFIRTKYEVKPEFTHRNYEPSQKAIERLSKYYIEKLFLFGVSRSEFDW